METSAQFMELDNTVIAHLSALIAGAARNEL